jgi:flagellar M-ring protein FliF
MSTEAVALGAPPRWLAGVKPILLLVGVALAVAAGVIVVLWSRGPSYTPLFANLGAEDQTQVAQALDAAGIPYQLEPGTNAIAVASDRVNDARLKLAGQGLPQGDGGFAVMSKDPGFGLSQFMENARYQHALESELARTISSLRPVESARVHLAIPRQSAFVRDQKSATASVFVQLKAGHRLEQEQIQSILNLVASSIPDLDATHVTVVDQLGRLLSAPQANDEVAQREEHFAMAHRLEDDYTQRIEALLTPLVGAGRVRAQVVAQLDSSVTEEAHEEYRPESQIVRSEQSSEQMNRDSAGNGGVPGSLSNQPPAAGVAAAPAAATAAAAKPPAPPAGAKPQPGAAAAAATPEPPAPPESTSRQSTKNYELDRTLAYTRRPSGRLQKLSVAVLIDNMRSTAKDGSVKETALTAQQIEHITGLVKDAVGFDAARGDTINVVNAAFHAEVPEPIGPVEQIPLWERPMVRDLTKLGAGVIVLLVLTFVVLRPLVRGLLAQAKTTAALPAPGPENAGAKAAAAALPAAQSAPLAYEQQLAQARSLVSQDPKRVAQVVRTWVAQDE